MAAAGLPIIKVYLSTGAGSMTFTNDITAYARLADGYTITRGRSDELSTVQPGTLTLTLDNTDGRFTLGSGTYGIVLDQMIRVTVQVGATVSTRFTGFVQEWPVNWPDGSDLFSTVTVNVVDASARWSRRVLNSITDEAGTTVTPVAYFPLSEPVGATGAADLMGGDPLRLVGTLRPLVFGQPSKLAVSSSQTAVQFTSTGLGVSNQFLYREASIPFGPGYPLIMETFFTTTMGLGGDLLNLTATPSGEYFKITVQDTTGLVYFFNQASGVLYGPAVTDGNIHHAAAYIRDTGASTLAVDLYVDGLNVGTLTGIAYTATLFTKIIVGRDTAGTASNAAVFQSSNTAAITTRAQSGVTGFAGERSDQRIARLIGYEGTLTTVGGDIGQVLMPAFDTAGRTVADAVEQITAAEGGLLWIDGTGAAKFFNKDHVALATSSAMTLPISSDMVDPGTGFSVDMQQVTNYVTAKRESDAVARVFTNPASIAAHGRYAEDFTYLVQTDNEAQSRGQWIVSKYSDPKARLPTLGLDLLSADQANQLSAIALDLDAHILITGWPSQSPLGTSTDLLVEGYTETLNLTTWELSLNCASWTQQAAFILDSSTYGVLNTNLLGI